jgi:GNAT superfamily N-acetyltransferase
MDAEIRAARESDIPELVRLVQGIAAYHESIDDRIRYDWEQVRKSADWLKLVLNRDHHRVWVASLGDERLAGYLWVHLRRFRDARIPPVWGYISQAFLDEAWRGRGLMRPMLDRAFEWFRERGITHVNLGVNHRNWLGSSAWYKFGFEDYGHDRLLILKDRSAKTNPPQRS